MWKWIVFVNATLMALIGIAMAAMGLTMEIPTDWRIGECLLGAGWIGVGCAFAWATKYV